MTADKRICIMNDQMKANAVIDKNKKIKESIAIVLMGCIGMLLCSTGCNNSPAELQEKNTANASMPEFVCITPKGNLYVIEIDRGRLQYDDRVYFFDTNPKSVTINRSVQSGKNVYRQAILVVDGVEYVPKQ